MSKGVGPHLYADWSAHTGIDPRNGKKLKNTKFLNTEIKKQLRVLDEAQFCNRYTWYNLPSNLSSQELERLLYYKGTLCAFYFEEFDEVCIMPYCVASPSDGLPAMDWYGRPRYISPVPFCDGTSDNANTPEALRFKVLLSTKHLKVLYGQKLDEITIEDLTESAVILNDYTPQLGGATSIIPRQQLNDALIEAEAKLPCYMMTALKNSTGIVGERVDNADEASNVYAMNDTLETAALQGDSKVPVIGKIDFQELTTGTVAQSETFMSAMQSLDNFRTGCMGLENGGVFAKKAHLLETEADQASGLSTMALDDGLANRLHFCNILNSFIPLGIWCEISETQLKMDKDGDGEASNNGEDMQQEETGDDSE